ncbi:MAG: hypothetical protein M3X11_15925 [Acidobacteriota bacterium]|nr:hypothetical protein [Acidobacteriota bacterium]
MKQSETNRAEKHFVSGFSQMFVMGEPESAMIPHSALVRLSVVREKHRRLAKSIWQAAEFMLIKADDT